MKPYDGLPWWCQLLDPWFGPPWYAKIEDFDAWLVGVREQLAWRAYELTDELAGDNIPGEGYLAMVRRLTVARHPANRPSCTSTTSSHQATRAAKRMRTKTKTKTSNRSCGTATARGPRSPVVDGGECKTARTQR
jgi:hypothetical protein